MTAQQIIDEILALPPEQQREIVLHFQEKSSTYGAPASEPRHLDRAAVRPLIKEILTEHAELFRKLAQ